MHIAAHMHQACEMTYQALTAGLTPGVVTRREQNADSAGVKTVPASARFAAKPAAFVPKRSVTRQQQCQIAVGVGQCQVGFSEV